MKKLAAMLSIGSSVLIGLVTSPGAALAVTSETSTVTAGPSVDYVPLAIGVTTTTTPSMHASFGGKPAWRDVNGSVSIVTMTVGVHPP